MVLTLAQVRDRVTSNLSDQALQLVVDDAYGTITQWVGPEGDLTDMLPGTHGPLIALNRPATAITSITENGMALDPTDFQLRSSGGVIERLRTGVNPGAFWKGRVDVVYTPRAIERDRVAIALVKLELAHNPGVVQERIGDYEVVSAPKSNGALNYDEERESILGTLLLDQVGIY